MLAFHAQNGNSTNRRRSVRILVCVEVFRCVLRLSDGDVANLIQLGVFISVGSTPRLFGALHVSKMHIRPAFTPLLSPALLVPVESHSPSWIVK